MPFDIDSSDSDYSTSQEPLYSPALDGKFKLVFSKAEAKDVAIFERQYLHVFDNHSTSYIFLDVGSFQRKRSSWTFYAVVGIRHAWCNHSIFNYFTY